MVEAGRFEKGLTVVSLWSIDFLDGRCFLIFVKVVGLVL